MSCIRTPCGAGGFDNIFGLRETWTALAGGNVTPSFGLVEGLFREAETFSLDLVGNSRGGGEMFADTVTGRASRRFLRGPFWSMSTSLNFSSGKDTATGTTSGTLGCANIQFEREQWGCSGQSTRLNNPIEENMVMKED